MRNRETCDPRLGVSIKPVRVCACACVCFEGGGIYSHSMRSEVKIYPKSYQSRHAQLSACYVTLTGGGKLLIFVGSRFACRSLCTCLCSLCNIFTGRGKSASPQQRHIHFVCITLQHYTINGCFSVWLIVKAERAK